MRVKEPIKLRYQKLLEIPNVDLFWCNQFWRNFVYS